jgi:hypothetical protein
MTTIRILIEANIHIHVKFLNEPLIQFKSFVKGLFKHKSSWTNWFLEIDMMEP